MVHLCLKYPPNNTYVKKIKFNTVYIGHVQINKHKTNFLVDVFRCIIIKIIYEEISIHRFELRKVIYEVYIAIKILNQSYSYIPANKLVRHVTI